MEILRDRAGNPYIINGLLVSDRARWGDGKLAKWDADYARRKASSLAATEVQSDSWGWTAETFAEVLEELLDN